MEKVNDELKLLSIFSDELPKFYTYKIINWYDSFKMVIYYRGLPTADELIFDFLRKEYLEDLKKSINSK